MVYKTLSIYPKKELFEKIKELAEQENRSMNNFLLDIIIKKFQEDLILEV